MVWWLVIAGALAGQASLILETEDVCQVLAADQDHVLLLEHDVAPVLRSVSLEDSTSVELVATRGFASDGAIVEHRAYWSEVATTESRVRSVPILGGRATTHARHAGRDSPSNFVLHDGALHWVGVDVTGDRHRVRLYELQTVGGVRLERELPDVAHRRAELARGPGGWWFRRQWEHSGTNPHGWGYLTMGRDTLFALDGKSAVVVDHSRSALVSPSPWRTSGSSTPVPRGLWAVSANDNATLDVLRAQPGLRGSPRHPTAVGGRVLWIEPAPHGRTQLVELWMHESERRILAETDQVLMGFAAHGDTLYWCEGTRLKRRALD